MSRGYWLWEAPSVVFYEAWMLQEVLWRLEVTNVLKILALGGSKCCIRGVRRLLEVQILTALNGRSSAGGSA